MDELDSSFLCGLDNPNLKKNLIKNFITIKNLILLVIKVIFLINKFGNDNDVMSK